MPNPASWRATGDDQCLALAHGLSTLIGALIAVALCVGARLRPGPRAGVTAETLTVILVGEQVGWPIQFRIHIKRRGP
jgi:hypothetical protein